MRRVTRIAAVLSVGALSLAVTACGSSTSTSSSGSSGGSDSGSGSGGGKGHVTKVGLAYDIGGPGDQSFNDAALRGLNEAKAKYKFQTKELEPRSGESDADKVTRLQQLAQNGYNPVVAVGFAYANALKKVAPQYPKTDFAIVDDATVKGKNVTNLVFHEEQGSFLVGAAAALKTKTNVVGFVGGVNTPLINKFDAGYQAGVEYMAKKKHKKIRIERAYLSQPPDNSGFSSPSDGKTTANGQLDHKADVVYHAAGGSGAGVIAAVAGAGKWAIGVDSDQYEQKSLAKYKSHILTSMVKHVDGAVFDLIKAEQAGKPEHGVVRGTLDDPQGGVGYSTSGGFVNDIKPQLDALKKDISAGKIKVPETVSGSH